MPSKAMPRPAIPHPAWASRTRTEMCAARPTTMPRPDTPHLASPGLAAPRVGVRGSNPEACQSPAITLVKPRRALHRLAIAAPRPVPPGLVLPSRSRGPGSFILQSLQPFPQLLDLLVGTLRLLLVVARDRLDSLF